MSYLQYKQTRDKAIQRQRCLEHGINRYTCRHCEPSRYLKNVIVARINDAFRYLPKTLTKPKHIYDYYIGADPDEVWAHLQRSPTYEPWMTLETLGNQTRTSDIRWNMDHIVPIMSRGSGPNDEITDDDLRRRFHYTNIQPLSYTDNLAKTRKIDKKLKIINSTYSKSRKNSTKTFSTLTVIMTQDTTQPPSPHSSECKDIPCACKECPNYVAPPPKRGPGRPVGWRKYPPPRDENGNVIVTPPKPKRGRGRPRLSQQEWETKRMALLETKRKLYHERIAKLNTEFANRTTTTTTLH